MHEDRILGVACPRHIYDLIVIVIIEGLVVNNFLFYLNWLKINVDFILGSSELIIILLLSGIVPSSFSILSCASNTRQPLRLETSESSLTPSLPSPPILTSLQIRIYLVKHILKLTHFFHSSCHSLDPRFRYFIPGFLRWPFHISSSDNHLKYSLDLSTFNSSLSNFQDLYNQNSSNFLFFLFCSMMPVPE